MSNISMEQINQLEIPMTNQWSISIPALAKGELTCISATRPSSAVQPIEATIRGNSIYQPGDQSIAGTLTVVFYDNKGDLAKAIYEWMQKGSTFQTQKKMNCAQLKTDLILTQNSRQDTPITRYTCKGAWCTSMSGQDFTSEKNAPLLQITAVIQYDWYTIS